MNASYFESFKIKMLNWVKPFNIFSFLDHNHYSFEKPAFDVVLAAGSYKSIELKQCELFLKLKEFQNLEEESIWVLKV